MGADQNPFEKITVLRRNGPCPPYEITLQHLYDRKWWITFVDSNVICLVKNKYGNSFSCKFVKIYRGEIDSKTMRKIESFNNRQWKKYKHKMLGKDHETNN